MLDTDTAAQLSAAKLQQLWKTLRQQAGEFKQAGSVQMETFGKTSAVVVECRFEKMALDMRLTVDGSGRIARGDLSLAYFSRSPSIAEVFSLTPLLSGSPFPPPPKS